MRLLRKLTVAWILAWLPFSGTMAATMPFCAPDAPSAPQAAAEPATPHCEQMSQGESAPVHDGGCEHCSLCHIASSVVPSFLTEAGRIVPHHPAADPRPSDFSSYFPELPARPPASPRS